MAAVSVLFTVRRFFCEFREPFVGSYTSFSYPSVNPWGMCPVSEQPRKTAAQKGHVFDLGERGLRPANKIDYLIRRLVISDHPSDTTGAFPTTAPFRSPSPHQHPWELTRFAPHSATLMRRDGLLNDLQAAIGQYLSAEYDLTQPIPARLADLLRQLEQPSGRSEGLA